MLENVGKMDRFELKSNLYKFSVEVPDNEETQTMQCLLTKVIAEELLKSDTENKLHYKKILDISNSQLSYGYHEKGYQCTLVGCRFTCSKHLEYVKHLKHSHPNIKDVLCNFKKGCKQRFGSLQDLVHHLKHFHTSSSTSSSSRFYKTTPKTSCTCNRLMCQGRQFSSVSELISHWNCFHSNEPRDCIFQDCQSTFGVGSTSRHHFLRQHKQKNRMQLKQRHLVIETQDVASGYPEGLCDPSPGNESTILDDFEEIYDVDQLETLDSEDVIEEGEDFYLLYYADFLNRLTNFKHVAASTVQDIALEYLSNTKKALDRREILLRKSLSNVGGMSQEDIDKVVKDVNENDPFMNAQLSLNSEYKRKKYIQENMCYVPPQEIVLNKDEVKQGCKKEVMHYVPLTETFKTLLEDSSMIRMLKMKPVERNLSEERKLYDVKDGSVYCTNEFFKSNPDAYTAMLYSDGVEIKNPLGAARGCYKIVQVFMTLCEIDKAQRSQIDRVQLVSVFREKLLQKYSLKKLFKPIVDDLLKLEKGIKVNLPLTRTVKCGLLCYSADNLEAHLVGGWSGSFSSKDICRFCHCQYNHLEDRIHDYTEHGSHEYWTKEEYEEIGKSLETEYDTEEEVDEVQQEVTCQDDELGEKGDDASQDDELGEKGDDASQDDESDQEGNSDGEDVSGDESYVEDENLPTRGVRSVCPFNILSSFHCVQGFPFDVMHDCMEGIIPSDLLAINRILSSKGCFSIDQYNCALGNFEFSSYERNDKPYPLPIKNSVKKCRGKAVSQWVHLRIWPLLMMKFLDNNDDPVIRLGLLLHEIVERLTASAFYTYEIDILEEKVIEYLDLRKVIREEFPSKMVNPKPKHHFLRKDA